MTETIKFGNYIYEHGYSMVSNLLIDYQEQLDLTNDELIFIIKVYRHKNGYKIHDSILDSTMSTKTLQRRRKSLVDKGYLTYVVHKSNTEDGSITTDGVVYDFTALDVALMQLSSEIKEKESTVKVAQKAIDKEDKTLFFKEEYKKRYGKDYVLSADEIRKIKSLSKEEKNALKYIFNYCDDNNDNLPEEFHPRIAFFTQVKWRLEKLVEYASLKEEQNKLNKEAEEQNRLNKEAEDRYKSFFKNEKEEKDFNIFLKLNNRQLFMRIRNSMMLNIVDQLYNEYEKFIGVYNAK